MVFMLLRPVKVSASENPFNDNIAFGGAMNYIHRTMEARKDDVNLLARLIQAEAGSDYVTDRCKYLVGAVVLNRVDDPDFPDTVEGVIFQKGQYATAKYLHNIEPTKDVWLTAAELILWGCEDTPPDLVYQANFKQGSEVWEVDQTQWYTMYFCLK